MRPAELAALNKRLKPQGIKHCNGCGQTLPLSAFGQRRDRKDAVRSKCMKCLNAASLGWYHSNLERAKATNAAWYSDSERRREKNARYASGGRDPEKDWPSEHVGYYGAHHRVRATYGRASQHSCAGHGCSKQAYGWAYDGTDPNEFSEIRHDARRGVDRTMRWSGNPSYYVPLCLGCHNKLDRWMKPAEIIENWHGLVRSAP